MTASAVRVFRTEVSALLADFQQWAIRRLTTSTEHRLAASEWYCGVEAGEGNAPVPHDWWRCWLLTTVWLERTRKFYRVRYLQNYSICIVDNYRRHVFAFVHLWAWYKTQKVIDEFWSLNFDDFFSEEWDSNSWLDFGDDSDHNADLGIFKGILRDRGNRRILHPTP